MPNGRLKFPNVVTDSSHGLQEFPIRFSVRGLQVGPGDTQLLRIQLRSVQLL